MTTKVGANDWYAFQPGAVNSAIKAATESRGELVLACVGAPHCVRSFCCDDHQAEHMRDCGLCEHWRPGPDGSWAPSGKGRN